MWGRTQAAGADVPQAGSDALRNLLRRENPVVVCGVFDGISAIVAERAGAHAVWVSGLGVSAAKGLPDTSVVQMPEFLAAATTARLAVAVPVIADCDAGFGDINVTHRLGSEYAAAGIAAVSLEDKCHPKRNSFMEGHELADPFDFATRIVAVRHASQRSGMLVIARLEALVAGESIAEAVRRGRIYAGAGADVILVHSKAPDSREVVEFCRQWKRAGMETPIAALPTTSTDATVSALSTAGVKMVIFANQALRAAVKAMATTVEHIVSAGSTRSIEGTLAPIAEVLGLVGCNAAQERSEWAERTASELRGSDHASLPHRIEAHPRPRLVPTHQPSAPTRLDLTPQGTPMAAHGFISRLQIAVSYQCNLSCAHCYVPEVDRREYRSIHEHHQLEVGQITSFMDRLIDDYGLQRISVTGGEAMLNVVWPRTKPVVEHGLRRGLRVQLNTSGSGQVEVSQLAPIVAASPGSLLIHLSLDGTDEGRVNEFRGNRHAFQWSLDTLRDVVESGMDVQVRYTVTEENLEETIACYDLVTKLGAYEFMVKPMFAVGEARTNEDLIRTIEPIQKLQTELIDASRTRTTTLVLPEPVYVPETDFPADANVRTIQCSCGTESLYLSVEGDLYPCTYLVGAPDAADWVTGNITDPSFDFDAAWRNPNTWAEFRTGDRHGTCTAQNIGHRTMGVPEPEPATQYVALRSRAGTPIQ